MNRGDTDGKKIKKPSEGDRKGESGWRNEIENSRRGGGWERDERERDVGGGGISVLWLAAASRSQQSLEAGRGSGALTHKRRRRRSNNAAGAVTHSYGFFSSARNPLLILLLENENRRFVLLFLHARLNNAALSGRRGQGFTASFLFTKKGESHDCSEAVWHIFERGYEESSHLDCCLLRWAVKNM